MNLRYWTFGASVRRRPRHTDSSPQTNKVLDNPDRLNYEDLDNVPVLVCYQSTKGNQTDTGEEESREEASLVLREED